MGRGKIVNHRTATGTYALILRLPRKTVITIGKLGKIGFSGGWYAYVGSAFGPGGLRARISRHYRREKTLHWHIDYLREKSEVTEAWITTDDQRLEHRWAGILAAGPFSGTPVRKFGSSDCRCISHLFYYCKRLPGNDLKSALNASVI
ncbi:MAG: GIY-YIG nuclease family protein [Desulfobacteraceae bacterium]|nr:GIY-YIG nuclease family protein [Desulfobacteraceae bacterium]